MCDSCGRPSVTEDLRDHSHGEAEHGAEVDTRAARAAGHHHPAGRVAGAVGLKYVNAGREWG